MTTINSMLLFIMIIVSQYGRHTSECLVVATLASDFSDEMESVLSDDVTSSSSFCFTKVTVAFRPLFTVKFTLPSLGDVGDAGDLFCSSMLTSVISVTFPELSGFASGVGEQPSLAGADGSNPGWRRCSQGQSGAEG